MTNREFLSHNERMKQRQAVIRGERKQTGPVRIGELLADVLADIQRRQALAGGVAR